MTVGTKSLLFGVHQFLLHPLFLAMGWNRLYGTPLSFRLWYCFFLHDIGYIGKTDMDGEFEGQTHPELGAKIIAKLFGEEWGNFCLLHSRFYAKSKNRAHSKLCTVDKLAFCYYPPKLFIFLARLSGEMDFYREFSKDANEFEDLDKMTDLEWYHALKLYTLRVVIKTNRNYYDHVHVGLDYNARDLSGRQMWGSVRGKFKGYNFMKNGFYNYESCRLWERRKRLTRELIEDAKAK